MRTKSSLSILMIAVAVIGFVVVSANKGTSAQPYAGESCRNGGSCGIAVGSSMPMHGGGLGPGRGWGRGARMGGWMAGAGSQLVRDQQCSGCESGAQSDGIDGAAAGGCSAQEFGRASGCGSGGFGGGSSCGSSGGEGQGRGHNVSRGRSRARAAGCGVAGGSCCSSVSSCDSGRGRGIARGCGNC